MATNDIAIRWGSLTDLTVTSLASLADGDIWQSGEVNDPNPANIYLRIWYLIVFNATPIAGDSLRWFIAGGDQHAGTEIWDGNIGTGEGQIITNAAVAEVVSACHPRRVHAWQTDHTTTFKGHFVVENFPRSWQVLVQADGEALAASGHRVSYEYGIPQVQP